jgi:hypothetical protein
METTLMAKDIIKRVRGGGTIRIKSIPPEILAKCNRPASQMPSAKVIQFLEARERIVARRRLIDARTRLYRSAVVERECFDPWLEGLGAEHVGKARK